MSRKNNLPHFTLISLVIAERKGPLALSEAKGNAISI